MANIEKTSIPNIAGRRGRSRPAFIALTGIMLTMPSYVLYTAKAVAQSEPAQTVPKQPDPPPSPPQPSPGGEQHPTPAEPTPAPPPPPPKGETPATVLDDKEVDSILGKDIRSTTGEDMGRIVDVLVNHSGQVRAAIIDFGGFLGVGSRKIAVAWNAIQFAADGKQDRIVVSLSRNELRVAPEYKRGEPVVVLGAKPAAPPAAANVPLPPADTQTPPAK
jgi:sporulation protein YlmC with PRC-barrel domain